MVFSVPDAANVFDNINSLKNQDNVGVIVIGLGDGDFSKYQSIVDDNMLFAFLGNENFEDFKSKLYPAICK